MHWIIPTVGSAGDVLPLITIGASLRARGHQVTLLANAAFREPSLKHGLAFVPLSSDEEYRFALKDKWLMTTRYSALFWARYVVSWNSIIYRFARDAGDADSAILSADRPNLWADLLAYRELQIPVFRARIDLPSLPDQKERSAGLPGTRVLLEVEGRWQKKWIDQARVLGIRAGGRHVPRLSRSTRPLIPTLALWPDALVRDDAAARDVIPFGFVFPSVSGVASLQVQRESEPFGPDHLVFLLGTEGTTGNWSKTFIEVSGAICDALGCRGVVLGGKNVDRTSIHLSPSLHWETFTPIADALRGARAIVHHGGIGTAAAAIAGGIPQLIVPRVFMQPTNAEWLRRAGLCSVLEARDYTCRRAVTKINKLTSNNNYRARANQIAGAPAFEADQARLCGFLEKTATTYRASIT